MDRSVVLRTPIALIVFVIGIVITVWLGTSENLKCLIQGKHAPADAAQFHGTGEIYFVPIGDFPRSTLEDLGRYYEQKYRLTIHITSAVPPNASAYNPERRQWAAEDLVASVNRSSISSSGAADPVMIAFTDQDLYIREFQWRYAFGRWDDSGVAVLSSARMSYPWLGFVKVSQTRRDARLRKMVTRYIGHLYYKLPFNDECQSVLYRNIGGPQELDFMGEDL